MQINPKHRLNLAFIILMVVLSLAACKSRQSVMSINVEAQNIGQSEVSRFSQAEQMTVDNAFLEGVKRMMIEDYGEALNIFMDVLQMDNQYAPANFEISKIKLMQNQPTEAEVYAERACRLSPKNKYYLEHLVLIYRQNNKSQQALNNLERLIRLDPRNEDYLYETADLYLVLRKPMEAVRIYDSIEKRIGISDEISMQKIKIYQVLNKDENVRAELQKLIRKFSYETKYWAILAELNMQADKYQDAFSDYQKILSIDPENPYVHLSLADYYRVTGDTVKTLSELILAFQNPRLDIDSKVTLVLPYYNLPAYKQGTYEMLNAILSVHPEEPKALALYADFLQRDNRYGEAREKYQQVIAIDASRYQVWEALLFCDLSMWDTIAMLRDAQNALDRFPEQPLVYYILGTAYNLKADYAMAMQYLEQGVQLAQSNKPLLLQIYTDLGDVYHRLENGVKSDQCYREALNIDPQNVMVLNNFAYFLSLRKEQLDEAEKMARLACQKSPNNPTFLDTFAWVLYQQSKYKDAKAIMELALQYGGEKEATLLEHYGDILWKSGEKEQALNFWKQAQSLDEEACSEQLNEKIKTETLIEN